MRSESDKSDILAFRASPDVVALVELAAACRGVSKSELMHEAVIHSLQHQQRSEAA